MTAKPRKRQKPKTDPKSKGGRPSKFSEALIERIATRLSEGEPLAQICRDAGMPGLTTIWEWKKQRPAVSERLARARDAGFDQIAQDALNIADDGRRDYEVGEGGALLVNHDHIQRSKLRIETRLKLLAVWDPKRYGAKVQLADADGEKLPEGSERVSIINVIGMPGSGDG